MFRMIVTRIKAVDFTVVQFQYHLIIGFMLRMFLVGFSVIQDQTAEVPFTDIDYKVVTDGARHVWNNESPFRRHTYRYSPLLAYLLIPNIIFHECFGKFLFSCCDLVSSILIRSIVYSGLKQTMLDAATYNKKTEISDAVKQSIKIPDKFRKWSDIAAYMVLYNPVGMIISCRGSNDAVSNLLILITFYFIQKCHASLINCIFAGIFHGLAIHFRIFPIIFSLSYYLCVSNRNSSIWRLIFFPNRYQITLAATTIASLITITYTLYTNYGVEYLNEAYFYHFSRVDTRHNFSLYFLMQYLNSNISLSIFVKLLTFLPRIIILFYLSVTFGRSTKSLAFCIFAQTFIFVAYNTVVTSQYFVWYLTLLPLCYPNFRHVTRSFIVSNAGLWLVSQGFWLLAAYLLEFKCWNTFNLIGIQSVVFFLVNIFVLHGLIVSFNDLTKIE